MRDHRSTLLFTGTVLAALLSVGCAAPTPRTAPIAPDELATRLASVLPADALLLGEQHDAPEHQQLERQTVEWLASRGQLAALVIEMAEAGHGTVGLPRDASEAEVRAALNWQDAAWPWASYGPVVMAAVRAGVPVLGANLPGAPLRQAMGDASLDARLSDAALAEQAERIREGHCNALPESQIRPMTRVQIARDLRMAATVAQARRPGATVLLVAGNGHVDRRLGVPVHLPPDLRSSVVAALADDRPNAAAAADEARPNADLTWPTPPRPPRDYCAQFQRPAPIVKP